jgi:hypothetical protein
MNHGRVCSGADDLVWRRLGPNKLPSQLLRQFTLRDEEAITVREESAGEERFVTIGMAPLARVLVAVYAWRADPNQRACVRRCK